MRQKILGVIALIIFSGAFIMIVMQETFKDILIPLGLYHTIGGAWTDCSLPENSHVKYCEGDDPPAEKEWKGVRDKSGFDLSGN